MNERPEFVDSLDEDYGYISPDPPARDKLMVYVIYLVPMCGSIEVLAEGVTETRLSPPVQGSHREAGGGEGR